MATEIIKSKLLPSFENVGIAHAVRNGNFVFISGQIPLDAQGNIVGKGDVRAQTVQIYEILKGVLEEIGGSLNDIMEDRAATNGGTHCPPPRMPRKRSALTPLSCRMVAVPGVGIEPRQTVQRR